MGRRLGNWLYIWGFLFWDWARELPWPPGPALSIGSIASVIGIAATVIWSEPRVSLYASLYHEQIEAIFCTIGLALVALLVFAWAMLFREGFPDPWDD